MKIPSFIIAGAPKSGTNSLREYLRSHPKIFMPPGEVHYFDKNFEKGIDWYLNFFKEADEINLIGEKTPNYMYSLDIAENIHSLNPKMKLIFLLRNPVDRAYSNYWHNYKAGRIDNNFEENFKNYKNNYYVKECIENSKYIGAIDNFKKFFSNDQILLLKAEDLKNKRKATLDKVFDFLDVDNFYPENLDQEYNIGKKSRSEFITKAVKKFENIKNKKNPLNIIVGFISMWNQKRIVERAFRRSKYYKEFKIKKGKTYPKIQDKTRSILEEMLKQEIDFWRKI